MSLGLEELYALLPAVFRTRDAAAGEPLKALLGVICEQVAVLDNDLSGLYEDAFIETCSLWVIPYLGDLVGWQAITPASRAEVADTVGYRRRKGTLLALEQIARDVTSRPTHAVEYFRRLATTESMHHVRAHHASTLDLRRGTALERMGAAAMPFDCTNRTIDVRRIAPRARMPDAPDSAPLDLLLHGAGRYNLQDIGMFLWRWRAYPVRAQRAFRLDAWRFMFSPLGNDIPLFNQPVDIAPFAALSGRMNVPQPIERREFFDSPAAFYGPGKSVQVYRDGAPVPLAQICICDLSGDDATHTWPTPSPGHVTIDPVLGRIAFAAGDAAPDEVRIDYCYGFPADIGGGTYDRTASITAPASGFDFTKAIGDAVPPGIDTAATLEDAIAEWNALPDDQHNGMIVLMDMYSAQIDLTGARAVRMASNNVLWIVAGELHVEPDRSVTPGYADSRATLFGGIEVLSAASNPDADATPGELHLSGITLAGSIDTSGDALTLRVADCTLVPGRAIARDNEPLFPGAPSIVIRPAGSSVCLLRTICGTLLTDATASIRISTSIIDAGSRHAVAFAGLDGAGEGGTLHIEDSTMIGRVHTYLMELASNTIFLAQARRLGGWRAALWCTRQQTGCVRYCYLPASAIVPRHYACLQGALPDIGTLEPRFVTLRYGLPSYGLVSGDCPVAIWNGADDGGELGVYHSIDEPQAVSNLFTRLGEYLPFALEAGIFLVPSRPERRRLRAATAYARSGYSATPSWPGSPHASDERNHRDDRDADDDLTQGYTGIGAHLI
jgi:hypothetical protein